MRAKLYIKGGESNTKKRVGDAKEQNNGVFDSSNQRKNNYYHPIRDIETFIPPRRHVDNYMVLNTI